MKENTKNQFLSLQHLEKIYPNGEKAVYDFNLEIEKKEFIVIVGPSGCGKSTTLRMIAGLEDITSGDIYLEGELLNYKPSKDRKMAMVFQSYALYPQMNVYDNIAFPLTINTYPEPEINNKLLSIHEVKKIVNNSNIERLNEIITFVNENKKKKKEIIEKLANQLNISIFSSILLYELVNSYLKDKNRQTINEVVLDWNKKIDDQKNAELAKMKEQNIKVNERYCVLNEDATEKIENRKLTDYEIKTRVYETAEKLDLTMYLDKLPKELSGGQMQRVALGRAIIKNVPIFMMDEPLSNLDAKLRLTMRSEIVKLHNRINATTVYVTHDQTEAMTMATRIVVMSRGFIQQIGTPEEIYDTPCNIFVARFIGSPSMNMFEMKYDKNRNVFIYDNFEIEAEKNFTKIFDKFYLNKMEEFNSITNNFDVKAHEKILKLLSVIGEDKSSRVINNKKQNDKIKKIINAIKEKMSKAEEIDLWANEKAIAQSKLKDLNVYENNGGKLIIGIRPERIRVKKVETGKKYDDEYIIEPTLFELLGGEYNVHFDFFGNNIIAQLDAKSKLKKGDKIAVKFLPEDLFVFDPITGDVIK